MELFRGEIAKFSPREAIIYAQSYETDGVFTDFIKSRNIPVHTLNEWNYEKEFMTDVICQTLQTHNLGGLGIETDVEIITAGSILQYLRDTHKTVFGHLNLVGERQPE